jgi:hypothetical protein
VSSLLTIGEISLTQAYKDSLKRWLFLSGVKI